MAVGGVQLGQTNIEYLGIARGTFIHKNCPLGLLTNKSNERIHFRKPWLTWL